MRKLYIQEEEAGQRLDKFLKKYMRQAPASFVYKMLRKKNITRNGKRAAGGELLAPGDEISLFLAEETIENFRGASRVSDGDGKRSAAGRGEEKGKRGQVPSPLEILYEDAHILIVNKPVGMVVHPAPGHPDGTLVNALMYHCGDSLSGIGGERRPGIVHRIDKDTSGLIIAAKNDFAHLGLSAQLSDHSLARVYECVVFGRMREPSGTVDAPIARHPAERKRMAVVPGGRSAVTHWEVIASYRGWTHLRCRLETGRTHQIRVHMAHIGHPLLGDEVYGRGEEKGLRGQCLHARELRFVHPRSGERICLSTELPEYFKAVLARLGPPEG